jgi:hypothetical protein
MYMKVLLNTNFNDESITVKDFNYAGSNYAQVTLLTSTRESNYAHRKKIKNKK